MIGSFSLKTLLNSDTPDLYSIPPGRPQYYIARLQFPTATTSYSITHRNPLARLGIVLYGFAAFTSFGATGAFNKQSGKQVKLMYQVAKVLYPYTYTYNGELQFHTSCIGYDEIHMYMHLCMTCTYTLCRRGSLPSQIVVYQSSGAYQWQIIIHFIITCH